MIDTKQKKVDRQIYKCHVAKGGKQGSAQRKWFLQPDGKRLNRPFGKIHTFLNQRRNCNGL